MKKVINAPERYVKDMLEGIYAAHPGRVKYAADDLRCYCTANKKPGKVAIITGGGNGHGRYEYCCIQSMEAAVRICINIIRTYATRES